MSAPFEILMAPYTGYLAPTGTAFPAVDAAPSGSWISIGTSGSLNYDPAGVTVTHNQTISSFTGAGSTFKRKVVRTDEAFTIAFQVADLSPAQYSMALDTVLVTTTATVPLAGEKHFEVRRGVPVNTHALLLRGVSTVDDSLTGQFEVAVCYQAGDPAVSLSKGGAAMLSLSYDALEVTQGTVATVRMQTGPHL